jgi:UDP-glucose 4-epimerase
MRVLITGGAGFIGSHLCDHLLAGNHIVSVIDDLSTGRLENIEHLIANPAFRFEIGSILDETSLSPLMKETDVVVHLAAAVGVRLILENPVHSIETNVRGTEVVLNLAARKGTRVLLASTSEVYGKTKKIPFSEEDDLVLGPTTLGRWSYACGKALDEFLALAYWKETGLPVTIFRLFNTVGPRQVGRYGMVLPRFVAWALAGKPLQVFGDGEQSRCFCHVADVVQCITRLLTSTQTIGQIYNVGSNQEISVAALAKRVIELTNSTSTIQLVPYEEAYPVGFEDMRRRIPDIRKIQTTIGFTPRYNLDKTILSIVGYQQQQASACFTSETE